MRLPERIQDGGVRDIMVLRNHQRNKKNEAFVAHFQLLGLRHGECRTNVIRSAAQAMAVALNTKGNHFARDGYGADLHVRHSVRHSAEDLNRARIAIATYRLLDPRERTDAYERVQLCYPSDRDEAESLTISSGSLIRQMSNLRNEQSRQALPIKAIEAKNHSDTRPEAEDSFKKVSNNLFVDERRHIVRLTRKSNESNLRGLSPLGWLRSQLGS